ncbi:MAG: hypothetical protein R3E01_23180 [Pirellulaceae bacterium]|nr:hypothetical protein [Planctomycetales bacterium]
MSNTDRSFIKVFGRDTNRVSFDYTAVAATANGDPATDFSVADIYRRDDALHRQPTMMVTGRHEQPDRIDTESHGVEEDSMTEIPSTSRRRTTRQRPRGSYEWSAPSRRVDVGMQNVAQPPRPHIAPGKFSTRTQASPSHLSPMGTADDKYHDSERITDDRRFQDLGTTSALIGDFRAQWEVDRFAWPVPCQRLLAAASVRISDIVRRLVAQVRENRKVTVLTSFSRGEGCTTLALCLAKFAAASGHSVALVDGHLYEPSLATHLGMQCDIGWQDLRQMLPFAETAVYSLDDQLTVFPAAFQSDAGSEMMHARAAGLVDCLSENFDLILIDGGPMFEAAHYWFEVGIEDRLDAAIVVRDVRHTVTQQIDDVCCRIAESGIRDIAIVENFQYASLVSDTKNHVRTLLASGR